jgi:hypothetical protein
MSKKQVSPGSHIGWAERLLISSANHAADRIEKTNDRLQRLIEEWIEEDDEADSTADDMVPELGQKLLPFLLPRKLRDAVAGDLAQDFQGYLAKFGRTYAVRWYWWELGRLCISRFSPTAIVGAIAFWLHRKIGF